MNLHVCVDCGAKRLSKKPVFAEYAAPRCWRCANERERQRLARMFKRPYKIADKRKGHR